MSLDQVVENSVVISLIVVIVLSVFLIMLNIRVGRKFPIFINESIKRRKEYNKRIRVLKNKIINLGIHGDSRTIEKWEKQIEILENKRNMEKNYGVIMYEEIANFSDILTKVKEVIKVKNFTIFSIFLFLWSIMVIYIKYYILNSFKVFKFISTKDIVDISFSYFLIFIFFLLLAILFHVILRKWLFKYLKKRRNPFFTFIPNWIIAIMISGMALFLSFKYGYLWYKNVPTWFYYIVFIILFQNALLIFNLKRKNIAYSLSVLVIFSIFLPVMDDEKLVCDIKTRNYYFEGVVLSKTSNVTIMKGSWKLSMNNLTTLEEFSQKYNVYVIQNSAIDYTECKKNKKMIWIPIN